MIFARGSSSTTVEAAPLGWVPSAIVVALVFLFIAACFGGLVWCWLKAGKDADEQAEKLPLYPPFPTRAPEPFEVPPEVLGDLDRIEDES